MSGKALADRLRHAWSEMPPLEIGVFRCSEAAEAHNGINWPCGKRGAGVWAWEDLHLLLFPSPEGRRLDCVGRFEQLLTKSSVALKQVMGGTVVGARCRTNEQLTEFNSEDLHVNAMPQVKVSFRDSVVESDAVWPVVTGWASRIADPTVKTLRAELNKNLEATNSGPSVYRREWPCVVTMIADVIESLRSDCNEGSRKRSQTAKVSLNALMVLEN